MLVLYLILNSLFNWTRLICLEGHAELLESLGGDETYSPGNYGTFYILPILVFQFKNSINIKIINIKQFIILKMSCLNIFINITLSCFKLCLLTAVFFSNRGVGITLGNRVFPVVFFFFNLINFFFSGFCHTLTWLSHGYTCIPHPDPPSHLPLHPIPLGLPSAPGPSTCLLHPTWADLFHPR